MTFNIKKGLDHQVTINKGPVSMLQRFFILCCLSLHGLYAQDDGFGTALPSGVETKDIIQLLAPDCDTSLVTLIGMKRWPYKQNTYLTIICASRNKETFSNDISFSHGKQCCNAGYGGVKESKTPKIVYLSMLEYFDTLRLIASYPGPLNIKTSWKFSNIELSKPDWGRFRIKSRNL